MGLTQPCFWLQLDTGFICTSSAAIVLPKQLYQQIPSIYSQFFAGLGYATFLKETSYAVLSAQLCPHRGGFLE